MIYVLIPAHNEAATVGLLLWKVRQLFTSFNREYQLIVVNDGSTDATDDVLAPYARALPLTVITHRKRQGYARSLDALLRETMRRTDRPRRDYAVTLQADFSDDPEDLLELIKRLEGGADVAVADRRRRSGTGRLERFARGTLAALMRRRLSLEGADDVVGTMRAYRLAVIEQLVREAGSAPLLRQEGWAADLELLARAAKHARRIESVEITSPRRDAARASRAAPLSEAWRAFRKSGALKRPPEPLLEARASEPEAGDEHRERPHHEGHPRHDGGHRRRRRGRGRGRHRHQGGGPSAA